jgi:uracil phosphoribosyltransferase
MEKVFPFENLLPCELSAAQSMNYQEALQEIELLDHPLVRIRLTALRDRNTSSSVFRENLRRISAALVLQSLIDLETEVCEVTTPLRQTTGARLVRSVVLVPVLRAGLGFAEAMLEVLPEAEVGHIGMARDERTHHPLQYYCKLPGNLERKEVLLLDPMLATGHSATAALDLLKEAGARRLRFLALVGCPEGVATVRARHPEVPIHLAALDEGLDGNCYIVPGLGDAGDRYFGTLAQH